MGTNEVFLGAPAPDPGRTRRVSPPRFAVVFLFLIKMMTYTYLPMEISVYLGVGLIVLDLLSSTLDSLECLEKELDNPSICGFIN